MFMCEGVKVLFRVALVIMRYTLTRGVRKRCPSMYETLDALKHLPVSLCFRKITNVIMLRGGSGLSLSLTFSFIIKA
jgi:hypothetical protein